MSVIRIRKYWYLGCIVACGILFVLMLPFKDHAVVMCRFTGSEKHIFRDGYYLPFVGEINVSSREEYRYSVFRNHFHPNRGFDRGRLIEFNVDSFNLIYHWKVSVEYPYRAGLHDNSAIPYFVHLYNVEEKFRDFLIDNINDGNMSLDWFLNEVCGVYVGGGPSLDLFDPRVQLLFSYDSNRDWDPSYDLSV